MLVRSRQQQRACPASERGTLGRGTRGRLAPSTAALPPRRREPSRPHVPCCACNRACTGLAATHGRPVPLASSPELFRSSDRCHEWPLFVPLRSNHSHEQKRALINVRRTCNLMLLYPVYQVLCTPTDPSRQP